MARLLRNDDWDMIQPGSSRQRDKHNSSKHIIPCPSRAAEKNKSIDRVPTGVRQHSFRHSRSREKRSNEKQGGNTGANDRMRRMVYVQYQVYIVRKHGFHY